MRNSKGFLLFILGMLFSINLLSFTCSSNADILREMTLSLPDGITDLSYGIITEVCGNRLIISFLNYNRVFIYERSGSDWVLQQELTVPNLGIDSEFGYQVDISDSMAAVCDPGEEKVYVFQQQNSIWNLYQIVDQPAGYASSAPFGTFAILNENTLVVSKGNPRGGFPGEDLTNMCFFFSRTDSLYIHEHILDDFRIDSGDIEGNTVSMNYIYYWYLRDRHGEACYKTTVMEKENNVWQEAESLDLFSRTYRTTSNIDNGEYVQKIDDQIGLLDVDNIIWQTGRINGSVDRWGAGNVNFKSGLVSIDQRIQKRIDNQLQTFENICLTKVSDNGLVFICHITGDTDETLTIDEDFLFTVNGNQLRCFEYNDSFVEFFSDSVNLRPEEEVQFTSSSRGATAYAWDFDGDGVIDSNEENPVFAYDNEGVYSVTLTIDTPDGQKIETKNDYITVNRYNFGCTQFQYNSTRMSYVDGLCWEYWPSHQFFLTENKFVIAYPYTVPSDFEYYIRNVIYEKNQSGWTAIDSIGGGAIKMNDTWGYCLSWGSNTFLKFDEGQIQVLEERDQFLGISDEYYIACEYNGWTSSGFDDYDYIEFGEFNDSGPVCMQTISVPSDTIFVGFSTINDDYIFLHYDRSIRIFELCGSEWHEVQSIPNIEKDAVIKSHGENLLVNNADSLVFYQLSNNNWEKIFSMVNHDISDFDSHDDFAVIGKSSINTVQMYKFENGAWNLIYELTEEGGFGEAIRLSSNTLMVSAPTFYAPDRGQVFLYNLPENLTKGDDSEISPMYKINIANYPNPFNPTTTICFSLQMTSDVELNIYNIKGQKVCELYSGKKECGPVSIVWDGSDSDGRSVGSGVYFYKLDIDGENAAIRKCVMLK